MSVSLDEAIKRYYNAQPCLSDLSHLGQLISEEISLCDTDMSERWRLPGTAKALRSLARMIDGYCKRFAEEVE